MPAKIATIPWVAVERLRRKAKSIKKQLGVSHHEALDIVARQGQVFPDWHHLLEAAKATKITETAFTTGLIVGMDPKQVGFDPPPTTHFIYDVRIESFLIDEFMEARSWLKDLPRPWRDEDEFAWDDMFQHMYFRSINVILETLDDVIQLCFDDFDDLVRYVRLKGQVLDVFPEDGDVVYDR